MPPFNLESFSSRKRVNKGVNLALPFLGNMASDGMFHVFPVRNAPSIFPSAQYLRAVRSLMPCFPANWATDIYSIIHAISLYRQVFIRYSGANILFFADNGKIKKKKYTNNSRLPSFAPSSSWPTSCDGR